MDNIDESVEEIEISSTFIKEMQKTGLFDAHQGLPPEFPKNPYYMEAYTSVKK